MRWEENELVVILSTRINKITVEHQCIVCKIDLPVKTRCHNFGIVDRKHGKLERWYTCDEHSHVFNYNSVEDCPEWLQRFLFDNRLTREIWFME